MPKNELDYAYYHAKNRCIFINTDLKLNAISDSEIEKFYEGVENKKLYELYGDYINYLLNKKIEQIPKL